MGSRATAGRFGAPAVRHSRLLAVIGALLALCAVLAPPASAHVELTGSQPADATSLARVPRTISLHFNEALSGRFRQVRLLDAQGHPVAGTSVGASADARTLTLTLPAALARGAYEVTWEALSQDDGHVSGGALVLGLGAVVGPAVRPAPAGGSRLPDAVLRWGTLALLLLMIGVVALAVVLATLRPGDASTATATAAARTRLLALLLPAAIASAAFGVLLLVRQAATLPGQDGLLATIGQLLGERWGVLWAASELLLLAIAGCALAIRHTGRSWTAGVPLALSAAALVLVSAVHAVSGHGASAGQPLLRVTAATVHLIGAGVWLGGVAALAVVLWPSRARAGEDMLVLRALRGRFSLMLAAALGLAVLTGLVALGAQVRSVDALLTTDYGQSLLVKTALMVLAALVGLGNAVLLGRMRSGDDRRAAVGRLSRLMAIEVAIGLGALVVAAQLTVSPPPRGPEFAAARPVRPPVLAGQVGDVLVAATPRPNRVGANVFTITTSSTRRTNGAPVSGVSLRLRARADGARVQTLALSSLGADKWTGGTQLRSAGGWQMSVLVGRPDGTQLVAPLRWSVEPADLVLPVRYSARALAPIADRAILILLAAALVLAIAGAVRARMRHGDRDGPLARRSGAVGKDRA